MITRRALALGSVAVAALAAAGVLVLRSRGDSANAATEGHFEIVRTPEEWQKLLTPEQYAVLREEDTERPFTSPLNQEKRKGVFACAGCDLPLFASETKFEFRHRLAELLRADRGRGGIRQGLVVRHAQGRGPLPPLRRPSRPCVQRRPEANRAALLHQRRIAEIRPRLAAPARRLSRFSEAQSGPPKFS